MTKKADDTALAKEFGSKVRALRELRGFQQNELAAKVGCDPGRICNIENGRHFPLWPMVKKLAAALGVSTDELPG